MGFVGDPVVGLLFPGQGSQFVGMGRDLAAAYPAAKQVFEEADDVLGTSLSGICWEGPESELIATNNAQPALMTHSIAVHRVLQDRIGPVAMAAGHSLGEFSAYVAAGALSFGDGIRTVRRRGDLMLRSGEERPGTMAALLGLDDEATERVCAEASREGGSCVPANYNSPGQIVISGDVPAVTRAIELARTAGAKRAIQLNVSGAFHSPLMMVAEAGLSAQLAGVTMTAPAFPVVSNVTAAPVTDADEARRLLIEQLTSPVRWAQSMQAMAAAGITHVIEIGPGAVLAGLMKRIDRGVKAQSVGTAAEIEGFVMA
ncbi:MAG: ACP S-malonyltransferase [Longimicrobiales bacterium]